MNADLLKLPGVKLLRPQRYSDKRGWFSETYRRDHFEALGIDDIFVQDNECFSVSSGTIRGLHFQAPPCAQAKLVRVLHGSILDVAVDLRRSSPTFLHHVAVRLDEEKGEMLYIPVGFAHGYCALEDATTVTYKVSHVYSPEHERCIKWDDPSLNINWPVRGSAAVLSDKDRSAQLASCLGELFD